MECSSRFAIFAHGWVALFLDAGKLCGAALDARGDALKGGHFVPQGERFHDAAEFPLRFAAVSLAGALHELLAGDCPSWQFDSAQAPHFAALSLSQRRRALDLVSLQRPAQVMPVTGDRQE